MDWNKIQDGGRLVEELGAGEMGVANRWVTEWLRTPGGWKGLHINISHPSCCYLESNPNVCYYHLFFLEGGIVFLFLLRKLAPHLIQNKKASVGKNAAYSDYCNNLIASFTVCVLIDLFKRHIVMTNFCRINQQDHTSFRFFWLSSLNPISYSACLYKPVSD